MKQVFRQALVWLVTVGIFFGAAKVAVFGWGALTHQPSSYIGIAQAAMVAEPIARKAKAKPSRDLIIVRAAITEDVLPALLRAIMHVESRGKRAAVSKKGARGLMQVMPLNLELCGLKDKADLHDEEKGMFCGARVFSRFLRHYEENLRRALWGYNAGHRGVEVIERCGVKNKACLGGYAVTVKYAEDVLSQFAKERQA